MGGIPDCPYLEKGARAAGWGSAGEDPHSRFVEAMWGPVEEGIGCFRCIGTWCVILLVERERDCSDTMQQIVNKNVRPNHGLQGTAVSFFVDEHRE